MLTRLPCELLELIFKYTDHGNLVEVGKVSRGLYNIIKGNKYLWKNRSVTLVSDVDYIAIETGYTCRLIRRDNSEDPDDSDEEKGKDPLNFK